MHQLFTSPPSIPQRWDAALAREVDHMVTSLSGSLGICNEHMGTSINGALRVSWACWNGGLLDLITEAISGNIEGQQQATMSRDPLQAACCRVSVLFVRAIVRPLTG